MPIIQETPVFPFPNDAKFGISWRLQTPLDFTCTKLGVCTGTRLFLSSINTDKTGYYQLIVDEPIFENSCSYDAVEKVMYFYDTRTYTLHDAEIKKNTLVTFIGLRPFSRGVECGDI